MARSARSILLVRYEQPDFDDPTPPALEALGTALEVREMLGEFNIARDGDPEAMSVLHGPGIVVNMPMCGDEEEVKQLLVTINDDTIAWAVIMRVCRELQWRMMQPG